MNVNLNEAANEDAKAIEMDMNRAQEREVQYARHQKHLNSIEMQKQAEEFAMKAFTFAKAIFYTFLSLSLGVAAAIVALRIAWNVPV